MVNKSKKELAKEAQDCNNKLTQCLRGHVAHWIAILADRIPSALLVGFLGYWFLQTIPLLAGKTTNISIDINVALAILPMLATAVLWRLEKSLREKDVRRLSEELNECRNSIDTRRASSGLPSSGRTRKGDTP